MGKRRLGSGGNNASDAGEVGWDGGQHDNVTAGDRSGATAIDETPVGDPRIQHAVCGFSEEFAGGNVVDERVLPKGRLGGETLFLGDAGGMIGKAAVHPWQGRGNEAVGHAHVMIAHGIAGPEFHGEEAGRSASPGVVGIENQTAGNLAAGIAEVSLIVEDVEVFSVAENTRSEVIVILMEVRIYEVEARGGAVRAGDEKLHLPHIRGPREVVTVSEFFITDPVRHEDGGIRSSRSRSGVERVSHDPFLPFGDIC